MIRIGMKLKRAIYLGYYIKQLEREKFSRFLNHVRLVTGTSKMAIMFDVITSVFTYNISVLEYFQFQFYKLSKKERETWAGTGHMYEYQLRMNPIKSRHILENKALFYKYYGDFFIHNVAVLEDLKTKPKASSAILSNPSGKLVFKSVDGNCGTEVEIRDCRDFDSKSMISYMEKSNYGLVEDFIVQHPVLNQLSSSAVNTIRIFTQLDSNGSVDILGCRLRISIESPVDNMAAGNIAAPIDEQTGCLSGPGVYSDITKEEEQFHPITDVKIIGFQIPFWRETLEMVKEAALLHPQNGSIGWDVVITKEGPGLIEGNHDWCKLLWQLPVKRGLKLMLKDYD